MRNGHTWLRLLTLLTALGLLCAGLAQAPAGAATPTTSSTAILTPDVCSLQACNVDVWGDTVHARSGPSTSYKVVKTINHGWFPDSCEKKGQEIYYGSYHNNWWIKIGLYPGRPLSTQVYGYVSEVFVRGGSNNKPIRTGSAFRGC